MSTSRKYVIKGVTACSLTALAWFSFAKTNPRSAYLKPLIEEENTVEVDSPETELVYPITDPNDPTQKPAGLINLNDPLNVKSEVYYDPITGKYIFRQTLGDSLNYRNPSYMTAEEYRNWQLDQSIRDYWNKKAAEQTSQTTAQTPVLNVGGGKFRDIFGSNVIDIRPNGSAELKFGVKSSFTANPAIPERQRRITTFDFDEQIQVNVAGFVGDKLRTQISYNTQSTFNFENQVKLEYTGDEDQIIQSIEAGNVSLPLNSSLITGSQTLFGVKTALKFGRATVTSIFSQQQGERKEIEVAGGAQLTQYEITADSYEANKHYYVNLYHFDNYDNAMQTLPIVRSGVQITRIEVWITNRNAQTENTRNILAFTDLGEAKKANLQKQNFYGPININYGVIGDSIPTNNSNRLYDYLKNSPRIRAFSTATQELDNSPYGQMIQAIDYEKLENARMLQPQEYQYNAQLGFISLNQSLNNDEVLGVAYQYTYKGEVYQVGEFSTDGVQGKDALYLKLLKPTLTNPKNKLWDLMMKNVYSLGAFQVSPQDFRLDVWYNNPKKSVDVNVIPQPQVDTIPLVQLVGIDRLNQQQSAIKDGVFDFVPVTVQDNKMVGGGTINPQNGRIYFSTAEPFGKHLEKELLKKGVPSNVVSAIAFHQLYDSTKIRAQQFPELNRFKLKGFYQSSSGSEISLNAFNIPRGSVVVTAGGVTLAEGQDYTVDYNFGRVKILNESILNSGTPIKISVESNSLFSVQTKTLLGTHVDYRISKDINMGATILNLNERPLTQKVNLGDEPIKNTIFGFNMNYRSEVPLLTKLVDKLPIIETKEKSYLQLSGEYAQLIPGQNRMIQGLSYIDDFEGSQSTIDVRSAYQWHLASIPQGQPDLFPESSLKDNKISGYNRAQLGWYTVDPLFFRNDNLTPDHWAGSDQQNSHLMREVLTEEVFPNRQLPNGTPPNIALLDLSYFPDERGPYNFDTDPSTYSAGLNSEGKLGSPDTRWAGIMRSLTTNDFEASNIEFIQFWVMDPFSETINGSNEDSENTTGGTLYFNLGNISEDILNDGSKSFENGLTSDGSLNEETMKETEWARVPTTQAIVNAFDSDPNSRANQDVGYDGLSDGNEQPFFADYIAWVESSGLPQEVKDQFINDPSNDNYTYYRDDRYDAQEKNVIERYKKYNNTQGNSPTTEQSAQINQEGYPTAAQQTPDVEDINQDNNLSESESYYQYKIDLRPQNMAIGKNFITDKVIGRDPNTDKEVYWYQFKVPLRGSHAQAINDIQDLRSIRFMRMFLKDFSQAVTLRFARLELVRGEWRRYDKSLEASGEGLADDGQFATTFDIGAVNVEENSSKYPIPYKVPPGIQRERNVQSQNLVEMNEQSLSLRVCNLEDGDARAAFRNVNFDILSYKKIRMYVHGEYLDSEVPVGDDEVTVFVRLGTDFENNYYEYEMPVKMTAWETTGAQLIWPELNNMVIDLDSLRAVKVRRTSKGVSELKLYSEQDASDPTRMIHVFGNPNLQGLKTIMIGIRNPKKGSRTNNWNNSDDGQEKCVEIWVNELRLTDFDDFGGWATQGRLNANLADFGNVALAGSYSTPGFGSLEKKLSERQRETRKQYDASTTLQIGQFFGKKLGVQLPLFLGYSRAVIDPMFDPLNPDIEFNESLSALNPEEQQERKEYAQDFTERRSFNLSNISISPNFGKSNTKPRPWNIKNFSLSYAHAEIFKRNQNYENDLKLTQNGGFNYNFSGRPTSWEPFKNIKFVSKSKWLGLIKDFNVYLGPKSFSHSSMLSRQYSESKIRANFGAEIQPLYFKTFNWNRVYNLKYDFTKSLNFDYSANNAAFIEEKEGKIDKGELFDDPIVQQSIKNFGKNLNYNHTANLNYNLPLSKFPITDWINVTTRYSAGYNWMRAPLSQDTLGNTIQNSRNVSINAQLNFVNLYNKIPYLKKINQKYSGKGTPAKGLQGKGQQAQTNQKEKDSTEAEKPELKGLEYTLRFLMMIKNVSLTYTLNDGLLLPGFKPINDYLGMSSYSNYAPGVKFISGGYQERDILGRPTGNTFPTYVAQNGWFIEEKYSEILNSQYTSNHRKTLSARSTIEPFNGLRIELNSEQNRSENLMQNFSIFETSDGSMIYNPYDSIVVGTFSTSVISWKTAFSEDLPDFGSTLFDDLRNNRDDVSSILAEGNPNATVASGGYSEGYGESSQEVLIGSFISTYLGKKPSEKTIDPFGLTPLPNWRVTFDGLSKIEKFKEYFKSIAFSHAYRSTFTIASYTTNLEAEEANGGLSAKDLNGNFISQKQMATVTLVEQISPLLGIDATLQNSLILKLEFKKDRNLSLSMTNSQITEIRGNEIVLGSGYRFEQIELPIKIGGKNPVSDLNIRADVSYRNNETIMRKIVEGQNQATAGQKNIAIKITADYQLGKSLTIRYYYDHNINDPVINTSFRTSKVSSGLALRFTLAQ
ncbi:MAG: cell surface protein SprA [Bacteroidia bacterium]